MRSALAPAPRAPCKTCDLQKPVKRPQPPLLPTPRLQYAADSARRVQRHLRALHLTGLLGAALASAACSGGERFEHDSAGAASTPAGAVSHPTADSSSGGVSPAPTASPSSDETATGIRDAGSPAPPAHTDDAASQETTTDNTACLSTAGCTNAGADAAAQETSTASGDSTSDTNPGTTSDATTDSTGEPSATRDDSSTESDTESDSSDDSSAGSTTDDGCPQPDARLIAPCGCGFSADLGCDIFTSHLVHRYSFEGAGSDVVDSVGGANGRAVDTQLDGSGVLQLNGSSGYVELPSGIFSALNDATFEIWVRWDGGDSNQRVFNFGMPGNDHDDSPVSFLSLSPSSGDDGSITVQFRTGDGRRGDRTTGHQAMSRDVVEHVVVVIEGDEVELYVSGDLLGRSSTEHRLDQLQDNFNWLGRALYARYPYLKGALYEFRVYDAALSLEQIAINELLGPDVALPHSL